MPRPSRVELAGVPLHVIQRGVNRMPCFFNEVDRRFYLKCLAKYAGRRQCAIHAYVLMTNHVHLLVTPQHAGGVARMMQDLGRVYVRTINLLHGRTGTLWDGRFKSSLIDSETYFLHCQRYIEQNPTRAGMVTHPSEYPWSSHEHYARGQANPLLAEHAIYKDLGPDAIRRRQAYSELFGSALPNDVVERIRVAANANGALGSDAFLAHASALAGREVKVPRRGRPRRDSG
jgi:putative transposase